MPGILQGKVAVITGAGRGLGRAHALAMACEGARVIVNDLGGASDGTGGSTRPADEVVEAIKKIGGVAVANYATVASAAGAESIVKTALDAFGRLDIMLNNAGILRDRMIFNMTDEEWGASVKVNLYGTFYCIRAACQVMKSQGSGRIISTSSISGLGNMGQANYSAAKEGVVGLTRTVAKDMLRYSVTCNAIRPRAATRLTLTNELFAAMKKSLGTEKAEEQRKAIEANAPEDVSPLVVFLASDAAANVTGCVFDVFGAFIALYDDPPRMLRTILREQGRWTPSDLVDVLPRTLLEGTEPPAVGFSSRLTPDAKGWHYNSKGAIREVPPVAL